ncbi:MAG: tRNA threonylcarbamoyladenosine dehydratase [Clostridiales bacterium]|nr:tRNA threonylcarbamoyladenosine dehydratase [Clostridiales bacterium]
MIMWNERTSALIGKDGTDILASSRVAVFGIGGVGSYAVEALARAGIGALDLIDSDIYMESNLNRQLYATLSTLGMYKTEAAKAHIHDINPDCIVNTISKRFTPENMTEFDFSGYDYVIDAIDSTDSKAYLAKKCVDENKKIISSMGAGNRKNPLCFKVGDIYSTFNDPLARIMRGKYKKLGIKKLKVVYSTEIPERVEGVISSLSCVTATAGLILAGEVIRDLLSREVKNAET